MRSNFDLNLTLLASDLFATEESRKTDPSFEKSFGEETVNDDDFFFVVIFFSFLLFIVVKR